MNEPGNRADDAKSHRSVPAFRDDGLDGKVAIGTGGGTAGDGIGNGDAAAILLSRGGTRVLVVDRQGAGAASAYGSIFPPVQNLLLAARGLDLGAALTTLHKMHEDDVKALLGIPENVETVALVPIGWPKGKYGPAARRPVEEVMHFERWQGERTAVPRNPPGRTPIRQL